MLDLLHLHKFFLGQHIKPGDTVADFTMGNGHDTLYLSQSVGENGHVYAFDIQKQALENTEALLKSSNAPENWTLILDSHSNCANYIKKPIKAGMFNLGWLPGADKQITTRRETTLEAVENAITLLDRDAILLVAVYPGHPEGRLEGEMLTEYFSTLSRYKICATKIQIVNSSESPFFFVLETK